MHQLIPTAGVDCDSLLTQVPKSARNILLIDCGDGQLGERIKAHRSLTLIGLECNPEQATQARSVLDEVIQVEPEALVPGFADDAFDCIVWANGFARVSQPGRLLKRLHRWLKQDGRLVLGVPNVRRHDLLIPLLQGSWIGSLDRAGHSPDLKFYTRREIEKLMFRSGFALQELLAVPGTGYHEWQRLGRLDRVQIDTLQIGGLQPAAGQEFYTSDYLVRAAPDRRPRHGLTSIVLVLHNQFAYTKMCLDSLRQFTDETYEPILVDNHSTDETPRYLKSLEGVRVITNDENRGFPAAANQGIEASQGDNILLLNNDTIVTTGWLRRMLDALHSDPNIGLAGPCSNNVSGPQQIPVNYQDLAELDGFAWDRQSRNESQAAGNGRLTDVDRLVGFCLLIKREVIERIGLLDEQFGVGNYEDDDFCRRAIQAGYRAVIAQDAFVHHFGSASFRGAGVNFAAILRENRNKYDNKWNSHVTRTRPETAAETTEVSLCDEAARPKPRPNFILTRSGEGGLLLKKNDINLSLCMIVRDNEGTIRPCLESIKPFVDEMIVVDTGSKDKTPEIALELGVRLFHFPWCDDFSAARNESLSHARGEWIFWMDSDDTIPAENGRQLRELVEGDHDPSCSGYVMQVHCPGSNDNGSLDMTVVDHVKLFQNRPDLRFEFRIHEQILPSIRLAGGNVTHTDIFVVHSGSDHSPEGQKRKLERDFRILHRELQDRGDHPFVLFNLGMTYADAEQYAQAIDFLNRCLEVSAPSESHLRKAYALLVNALCQTQQHQTACRICERGRELFPDDKELLFRSGMLHHHFGRLREAEHAYLRVLNDPMELHFASIDSGIGGFKARHNLAIVYDDLGELDKAEQQWRHAVDEQPLYRSGWQELREMLVKRGDLAGLADLAERLRSQPDLACEASIASARLLELRQDYPAAREELQRAVSQFPEDESACRELSRLLFEHFHPAEAKPTLEQLVRLKPEDAAAWHNLGTSCLHQERYEQAVSHFRQSLQLRGNSAETSHFLGLALKAAGRVQDAIEVWKEAQSRFPQHPNLNQALKEHGDARE